MARSSKANINLALLRGINVGGKNKLPMQALAGVFVDAGCSDVRTFIQSGNVIFRAAPSVLRTISSLLPRRIEECFGFRVPVVLRTQDELGDAIAQNPFLSAGVPQKMLHVYFLSSVPVAKDVATLDPNRSMPDAFCVHGREVYLQLPDGMARTKLTNAYFDSKLRVVSTARNWNTVLQLYELMKG